MPGFHLALYDVLTGAAVTAQDLTAAADPVITQRNSHLTITDPLRLLAAQAMAAALTKASIRVPTWNAQTIFNIDPLTLSQTQTSPPRIMYLPDYLPTLPEAEEIQIQVADTQAAGEAITAALFLATPDWNRNVPKGVGPLSMFTARVSVTGALVSRGWSALLALTFEQGLRSGVYAVVGAKFYVASALYFRLLFPRSTLYNGRAMRPGDLITQALGDQQWYTNLNVTTPFGVWGKFQTFELPQVEIWSSAAVGSATYQGMLTLVKMNDSSDPGSVGA